VLVLFACKKELSGIFENMIKKFKHSITLMAEIKPDLIPITNYLVWKNDTETNLIDKYRHHWQLMFA
jgi:hypothetical protein